jgi:hypothetical protein
MEKTTPEMLQLVNEVLTEVISENLRRISGYRVRFLPQGYQITLYAEHRKNVCAVDCIISASELLASPATKIILRTTLERYARLLGVKMAD